MPSSVESRLADLEASLSTACARVARAEISAAAALAETAALREVVKSLRRPAGSEVSEISDGEGDELRDAFARAVADVGRESGSGRKVFRNGAWVVEGGMWTGKEGQAKAGATLALRKAGTGARGAAVGQGEGKEGRRRGTEGRRVFRGGRWVVMDAHG